MVFGFLVCHEADSVNAELLGLFSLRLQLFENVDRSRWA